MISPDTSPIQHVVVIYQENHSFDDVLGQYCQTRVPACDGVSGPVTFQDGKTASNVVEPDIVPKLKHRPIDAQYGIHNRWDKVGGCSRAPYPCVTHVDPANIPNLVALANQFVVSDRTYAAGKGGSFVAHVTVAAGTYDGFYGTNPVPSKTGEPPRRGWGCPSHQDALWGPQNDLWVPSCIPDANGGGPYRDSPVPYVPTVMQQMEDAGLSWHIYQNRQGARERNPQKTIWNFCTYFNWCYANRFTNEYNSSTTDFLNSAQNGTLPNLSYLLPLFDNSQHNSASMALGDNYIGDLLTAIENSPEWGSTAVFITYDDCGCFYDHVTPPPGLGMRNPMVIVSPYAKPTYVDSTTAVQPYSMLTFIDHTFGLPDLNSEVGSAYDYANAFDFTQRPLAGPKMTTTKISAAERAELARLAKLPSNENDPT